MKGPKTKARLDSGRTAKPKTRIIHHPKQGQCIGPQTRLQNPELEDTETGKRTALTADPTPFGMTPFGHMHAAYRMRRTVILGKIMQSGEKGVRFRDTGDLLVAFELFEAGYVTCDDAGERWTAR